jgi:hypothetical protein
MPNIESEITNRFYRPARRSIEIYREKLRAIQDKAAAAAAPSRKRLCKFFSILIALSVLQIAAK